MKRIELKEIIKKVIREEIERDELGRVKHPEISYDVKLKKGEIDSVIATLKGKKSEQFTKAANDLLEIERLKEELKKKEDQLKNSRIRDEIAELFGADNILWTRTVRTVGAWEIMMSKDQSAGTSTQWAKVAQELIKLHPELKVAYESLLKQYTKVSDVRPPRLEPRRLDEGIASYIKSWMTKLKKWAFGYDKKLNRVELTMKRLIKLEK